MEVRQALADLAEVRVRLASVQRFYGLSGKAAIASGAVAVSAGFVQRAFDGDPRSVTDAHLYLAIWLSCLAAALAINYGALLLWLARRRGSQARMQVRTVGLTILPAIVIGGVLTVSLATHGIWWMLPGTWCMCYALGLFASKAMLPDAVMVVAVAFAAFGAVLLLGAPAVRPLNWSIMPLAFGLGQIAIGLIVVRDREL
jgi:hypothetical protein